LVSVISFSFLYLQSGGKERTEEENEDFYKKFKYESIQYKNKLKETSYELENIRERLNNYELEKGFSEEEKQKIIDGAVEQTSEGAIKKIFNQEVLELQNKIKDSLGLEKLTSSTQDIVSRIQREISDLRLRSNVNLLIGMSITAAGLYLLWSTVSIVDTSEILKQFASEGTESDSKFMKTLFLPIIPRVLLIIFVELFAYFFLRLYRDGLAEIKYFQNELTNIESKLISVQISFVTKQEDALKSSLQALSNTERNFILEKGQTTGNLEKPHPKNDKIKHF